MEELIMGSKERFYGDIQSLSNGVTGSCHLCIVKFPDCSYSRFIVDCGLFQGQNEEQDYNKDFPFKEESIEFALITHNHVDHVGRLPLMTKNGFTGKIYTTNDTAKLIPLALYDSCKVLKDVSKRNGMSPLYDDSNVQQVLSKVVGIPYNESICITPNIKVTFFKNGHLIGSALILVEISYPGQENINLLFTGDYNNKNYFFDVPPLPDRVLQMPITIMQESTYGTMDSTQVQPCFEENLLQYLSKNGTIVIPVFSLGRSQEILYFLKKLQLQNKLDTNIPIYFDGKLANRYTALYLKNQLEIKEDMFDFLPENLTFVSSENRNDVLQDENVKIIVTTSGMGSYGPAQIYIPTFIKSPKSLIHFTGYTAEGTLGNRLATTPIGEVVKVGGLLVEKQAEVKYTSEFSAHAKADELISFLQQFSHINMLIVNHGNPSTKETFAKRLLKEVKAKEIGIASRDYFFRVSPYHLVKTLPTKFQ